MAFNFVVVLLLFFLYARCHRTTSMLTNIPGRAQLPTHDKAIRAAQSVGLDLDEIQSNTLIGPSILLQEITLMQIMNVKRFKQLLASDLGDQITSMTQILDISRQPNASVNIAFTQTGLHKLGMTDDLGDLAFSMGQEADAPNLGDPKTNWDSSFLGRQIDLLLVISSDSGKHIDNTSLQIQSSLLKVATKLHVVRALDRPGKEAGHEHFGYMDGISQPAVEGFNDVPLPGQHKINASVIIFGRPDDPIPSPSWAQDGSFLVFRQLKQLVPEFNRFLAENPIKIQGLTLEQGSELLGARMVGRWKSGAPVDLAPLSDDADLAVDIMRNNNFTFAHPGSNIFTDQTHCPFSAHIRKTNPRSDFPTVNVQHSIIRAGKPYGVEVSDEEAKSNMTQMERGLAFFCYQRSIDNGFRFLQQSWANNEEFFPKKSFAPGFDAIIGANLGLSRNSSGLDPQEPSRNTTFITDFIQSRGGEYFFSPSISAIKKVLSQ